MSMYGKPNSCVNRTEGVRDPASQLTQTANKRRERATPAETDEQKQERLRKRRSRCSAQTANGRGMRTCQRERLAAKNTPERDPRFYSK